MKQSLAVKTFEDLYAELGDRARTRPAGSATVAALDGGIHGLGKKILEEAGEVWLAADHSKFNRPAMVELAHLNHIDCLFTDRTPSEPYTALLAEADVRCVVAEG